MIELSRGEFKTEMTWDTYNTVMRDRYKDGLNEARAIASGIIERICKAEGINEKPYIRELYNGNQAN